MFSPAVVEFVRAMGTKPVRISYRSPWQNGTAERWIGSRHRELLEHVVVLGTSPLVAKRCDTLRERRRDSFQSTPKPGSL